MNNKITKKSIIKYLDKLNKEGKEIQIKWEGGGDSGWVYLEIDGKQENTPEAEELINFMDDTLDYGSWAGEFNAGGYATYDTKTKSFIGENSHSETIEETIQTNITIKIPDSLWFDRLILEIESNYDETPNVSFNLDVINGFKSDAHERFEEKMQKNLSNQMDNIIINYNDNPENKDIDRVYTLQTINKDVFKYDNGFYIYTIDTLDVSLRTEETYDIILDLNEN